MTQKAGSQEHHRYSIRLKEYDYSEEGAYFITICAYNRECLFAETVEGKILLNQFGKIVCDEWNNTAQFRKNVKKDEYVVRPSHMHGILKIVDVGAIRRVAPTNDGLIGPVSGGIGVIVGQFKSIVTKRITPELATCQRKYYQHIIRNENELRRIREYTIDNLFYWQFDRENSRPAQEHVLYEIEGIYVW